MEVVLLLLLTTIVNIVLPDDIISTTSKRHTVAGDFIPTTAATTHDWAIYKAQQEQNCQMGMQSG
jgi:hypothetical protein